MMAASENWSLWYFTTCFIKILIKPYEHNSSHAGSLQKNASSKTHRCWLKFLQMLPHILVWSLAIHSPFTLSLFLSSSPSPPQLAFSSSHIWPPQFFTSFQKQLHPLPTSWRVVKKMFSSGYILSGQWTFRTTTLVQFRRFLTTTVCGNPKPLFQR